MTLGETFVRRDLGNGSDGPRVDNNGSLETLKGVQVGVVAHFADDRYTVEYAGGKTAESLTPREVRIMRIPFATGLDPQAFPLSDQSAANDNASGSAPSMTAFSALHPSANDNADGAAAAPPTRKTLVAVRLGGNLYENICVLPRTRKNSHYVPVHLQ